MSGEPAPVQATPPGPGGEGTTTRVARWLLGAFLIFAGFAHLVTPDPFTAQVPDWFPAPEATILISGLIEIGLGLALFLGRRPVVGWIVAAFFVVIFPGNISQFITGTDAFGLDSDLARGLRLLFQPVLVAWALWCTGAWVAWRRARAGAQPTR